MAKGRAAAKQRAKRSRPTTTRLATALGHVKCRICKTGEAVISVPNDQLEKIYGFAPWTHERHVYTPLCDHCSRNGRESLGLLHDEPERRPTTVKVKRTGIKVVMTTREQKDAKTTGRKRSRSRTRSSGRRLS